MEATDRMTIKGVVITQEMIDRFRSKYTQDQGGCWIWQASTSGTRTRYGKISIEGTNVCAPRFALTVALGRSLAPGLIACHRCDNMRCVNPDHLYEGTYRQNALDAIERGRIKTPGNKWARRAAWPETQPKLDADDVREIRARLAAGEQSTHIARSVGVSKSTISLIKIGKMWKDITAPPPASPT